MINVIKFFVFIIFVYYKMSTESSLIVPAPPLSRSQTITTPKNLSLILTVCGKALKLYGENSINPGTILIVLSHIIICVKKIANLNEEEQKQLALDAIQWLINNQKGLTDEEKQTLDLLAETVFPQAVELLKPTTCSCIIS